MPEVASVPPNDTVSGWLNQPLPSGARSAAALVTLGASASILNWRRKEKVAVPSVAVQVRMSALARNVLTLGQSESVAPDTSSRTVTALRYQPLSPAVPEVIV